MMSNATSVETVTSGADKAKIAAAIVLLVGSVVAYYLLPGQDLWIRVAVLLLMLAAAVTSFLVSEPGRQLIAYAQESVRETKKVVWPTRQESMQMTGYVFAFVVVMALMLWLTDKSLEWLLYSVILGWR